MPLFPSTTVIQSDVRIHKVTVTSVNECVLQVLKPMNPLHIQHLT